MGTTISAIEALLTAEELFVARTVPEYFAWTGKVDERLNATDETRKLARLGSKVFKTYREEVLPFKQIVASLYVDTAATIRFPAKNEGVDAIVKLEEGVHLYQITMASDDQHGYETALRMELLSERSDVYLSGPIKRVRGPNGKSHIEDCLRAARREIYVPKMASLAIKAIQRKVEKVCAAGIRLVVVIDNPFPPAMSAIMDAVEKDLPKTGFEQVVLLSSAE